MNDAPPLYVNLTYVLTGVAKCDVFCEIINVHTTAIRVSNVHFSLENWVWDDRLRVEPVFGYELDLPGSSVHKFFVGTIKSAASEKKYEVD